MAETIDIRELNERIERQSAFVTNLTTGMDQVIVGQKHLVESLLIGLLSDGHVLLEGVPGLAKTLAIKTLASLIDAQYSRIQFTPDLLPADVIGTMVYSQKDEAFQVKKGPVFANFVLADEINRAPAKVQSALLEAMQERQVTIGKETFSAVGHAMLDRPILRGGIPRTRAVRVRAVHAGQNRPEHRAGRGGVRLKALARAGHQLFLGDELHGPAVPVTRLHVGIGVDISPVVRLRLVGLAVLRGLGRGRGCADPRDRILAAHRNGKADLSA